MSHPWPYSHAHSLPPPLSSLQVHLRQEDTTSSAFLPQRFDALLHDSPRDLDRRLLTINERPPSHITPAPLTTNCASNLKQRRHSHLGFGIAAYSADTGPENRWTGGSRV